MTTVEREPTPDELAGIAWWNVPTEGACRMDAMNTFEGTLSIRGQIEGDRLHVYLSSTLRMAAPRLRNAKGPMLAKRWSDSAQMPLLAQPKFNGIRLLASKHGLETRTGSPILTLPHIAEALAPIFRKDPDLVLDGEAYVHDRPLARIAGSIMRSEPIAEGEDVQFYVFDHIGNEPYRQRMQYIAALLSGQHPALVTVPTVECRCQRDLDNHFSGTLALGFEGQMLRDPSAPYIRGRSNALLKRKPQPEADDVLFSSHDAARDHVDLMGAVAR